MNIYNLKQEKPNNKGITLVTLVITIILMLIIIGISISTSMKSLDSTSLNSFYTELEIIQKRVDDIASNNESYIDSNGKVVYIKKQGTPYLALSTSLQENLRKILDNEGAELGLNKMNFRYFTKEQLESQLGLMDIRYNVFIDFNTRTVIAEDGINVNGKTYNILFNETYFVKQESKDDAIVKSMSFEAVKYGKKNYKIIVTLKNSAGNDVNTNIGTLRYKKVDTRYWETADGLEIIVDELTRYDIEYEDNKKNKISETIGLYIRNERLTITVE